MLRAHSSINGVENDMLTTRSLFFVLTLGGSVAAQAGETYIFKDENGQQVISHSIPPHLARNGYKVVDSDTMRTIRVVPPEASTAESGEASNGESTPVRSRHRSDEQLLAFYSSVEDVKSARDRKLHDLDVEIGRIESQLESDAMQREKLEKQAAESERSAMGGNSTLPDSIQKLEERITNHRDDLEKRRREHEAEALNFQYEIERMECLTRRRSGPECSAP